MESTGSDPEPKRSRYRYESFRNARTIRILTLHPAAGREEPLSGELSHETLDESGPATDFDAISYVWGRRNRVRELRLADDLVLPVTQSIHDALQRLRLQDRPRRLWADQVCINQDDIEERSQQVDLMNLVYRNAQQVLVWLGHDHAGVAHDAMSMVTRLHGVFADGEAHKQFRKDHSHNLHQQAVAPWRPLGKLALLPWVNISCSVLSQALLTGTSFIEYGLCKRLAQRLPRRFIGATPR